MQTDAAARGAAATSPAAGTPAAAAPRVTPDALTNALGEERHLLDELAAVLRGQREAIAADDLQRVDDSVFATHRILATVGEARRRRRALCRLFANAEDLSIRDLERALGTRMTPELRAAAEALQMAARTLALEVAVSRQTLHEVMAAGDAYMRGLCGVSPPAAGYTPPNGSAPDHGGGVLIDRKV